MIVLGSDVLLIHHVGVEDPRRRENEEVFRLLKGRTKGITIYSLLDLVGRISMIASEREARELYLGYLRSEEHSILFPEYHESWEAHIEEAMGYLLRGLSYIDAMNAYILESNPDIEAYVTWRKPRLEGKLSIRVLTPPELVKR